MEHSNDDGDGGSNQMLEVHSWSVLLMWCRLCGILHYGLLLARVCRLWISIMFVDVPINAAQLCLVTKVSGDTYGIRKTQAVGRKALRFTLRSALLLQLRPC